MSASDTPEDMRHGRPGCRFAYAPLIRATKSYRCSISRNYRVVSITGSRPMMRASGAAGEQPVAIERREAA